MLFDLYIWSLIVQIEDVKVGAKLGKVLLNIMLYADDIILVAFSRICLQRLLDIVAEFGKKREIKFNPDKSVTMVFENEIKKKHPKKDEIIENPFVMNDTMIPVVNITRYLGIYFDDSGDFNAHLNIKINAANNRLGNLSRIGIYSKELSALTKDQIFQTMVRPILLHVCEVACYNKGDIKHIVSVETMMIKEMLGIHKLCHNTDLMPALMLRDTKSTIEYYKLKFMLRLLNHPYTSKLVPSIIKSLPEPRIYLTNNSSFLENIFKQIGIEYDYVNKHYAWNENLITSKCQAEIAKLERQFDNEKKREYVIKLRKLLNLPYDRMVNEVNLELLAIDPFHHLDGVEDLFNTQSDEEYV